MNIPEEYITSFFEKLKLCEYPNIGKMDEVDVRRILDKENRITLLTWALVKLIPSYEFKLEHAKQEKTLNSTIADLLHVNGICRTSEKNAFVSRTLKDVNKECAILNKLFISLTAGFESGDKENLESKEQQMRNVLEHPTRELMEETFLCDGKIFPEEYKIKTMTEEQRNNEIKSYQEMLNSLNMKIKYKQKDKEIHEQEINNIIDCKEITKEDVDENCKIYEEVSKNFAADFPTFIAAFPEESSKQADSSLGIKFHKIRENMDFIMNVLKSLNYLNELNLSEDKNNESLSETQASLRQIIVNNYVTSEEIIENINLSNDSI